MKNRGLTLVEVLIASAIFSIVVATAYMVLFESSRTTADRTRMAQIQEDARRVLDGMADEIRLADKDAFVVSKLNGAHAVVFRKPTAYDYAGGAVSWSTNIQYAYELSDVDANNNLVQDEGRLVRIQDGSTQRLCNYVKPGGLVIVRDGDSVNLELTLLIADGQGKALEYVLGTSVTLRNSSS